MKLSPRYVGASSRPFQTEVTSRKCMNYAASIGDDNPLYFDDEREGGIVAPPMLAVALTWPLSERIAEHWEADAFPVEVTERQVHFTESILWHRVMKPGDRLTIVGKVAAILVHRAGTILSVQYHATDEAGQPVFDEYGGALLRRVRCDGEPAGEENLPKFPEWDKEDEPLWQESIHIDSLASYVYDACANVPFDIHRSRSFAKRVGLPGIIFQGAATLSIAVRELINREAGGDPARMKAVSCRFSGMVFPDTDIDLRLLGKTPVTDAKNDLFFDVLNAEGKKAISHGYASILS